MNPLKVGGGPAAAQDLLGTPAATDAPLPGRPMPMEAAADAMMSAVPERPELYRINRLPDGSPGLEKDVVVELTRAAHQSGITQSEFDRFVLAAHIAARDAESGIPLDVYGKRSTEDLRRRWGQEFDQRIALARDEARRLMAASPKLAHLFTETHVGSNRAVIEMLATRGEWRAKRGTK